MRASRTFRAVTARAASSTQQLIKVAVWLAMLLLIALIAIGLLAWRLVHQHTVHAVSNAKTKTENEMQLFKCAEVNAAANNSVDTLTARLVDCRGQNQDIARRLSRAVDQRKAAEDRIAREARAGVDSLNQILDSNEQCRDRPVCRPISDELRRRWSQNPHQ